MNETLQVLRRNIDATSLKIPCIHLYSVKSYDGANMNVLFIYDIEKNSWVLTYFDEFTWNSAHALQFQSDISGSFGSLV